MKKVLITGADSYIGTSFENWTKTKYANEFEIDVIDMKDGSWKKKDFSKYDTIFHVAGIAHADVGKVSEETKKLYYKVNRDLAIDTAKKAKSDGVRQFVFMSSMIIYGESAGIGKRKIITKDTIPHPENFYGDSKWQADKEIRKLESDEFHAAVLRPPMIYGKGSKGNYPLLVRIAKKSPVFPDIKNERSMLYIGNLCEFLSLLILDGRGGIFFPQNEEYVQTSGMVKQIAKISRHKIWITKMFNPFIWFAGKIPGKIAGVINKAFGNIVYEKNMSSYSGIYYQKFGMKESLKEERIENVIGCEDNKVKGTVLFLVNHDVVIYNFRRELVEQLLIEGYKVVISSPYGNRIEKLIALGCEFVEADMDRHGTNPAVELKLLNYYIRLIRKVKPSMVLSYTIKPNIYGSIASQINHVPYMANITGLGSAVGNEGILQKISTMLYRIAFRKAVCIFLQNTENMQFFIDKRIAVDKLCLIPGSGVNLEQFHVLNYPKKEQIEFVFISRIMKEKGIYQYLEAAKYIHKKYPETRFHICGFCEEEFEKILVDYENRGIIVYHGMVDDVRMILNEIHCTIHPSYYAEGLSNILLESCACGRPVITTNQSGCREVVDDGVNGYLVEPRNSRDLIAKIEKFIQLPYERKKQMGLAGREKVEKEYNRQIVVNKYMNTIRKWE